MPARKTSSYIPITSTIHANISYKIMSYEWLVNPIVSRSIHKNDYGYVFVKQTLFHYLYNLYNAN